MRPGLAEALPDVRPVLVGYLDAFTEGVASGWAYDEGDPLRPVVLHVILDGQEVATVRCDQPREDVRVNLGHPTGEVGWAFELPLNYLDDKPHRISIRFPDRTTLAVFDPTEPARPKEFLDFVGRLQDTVQGYFDGVRQGQLRGWALRSEPRAKRASGGCTVLLTCDGTRMAQVKADRWRWDVASRMPADPACGFQVAIPERFRRAHPQSFRAVVMPDGVELGGSPCVTSVVDDQLEASLLDVAATAERLQAEIGALRKRVDGLLPRAAYTVDDYDAWARVYHADLRRRVVAARPPAGSGADTRTGPLVSVIVPAFKPLLSDFVAAVESVLAQTYQNWELVIVDDASRDPALTAQIEAFRARDPRIKAVTRRRNGNISEATNTAIKAATGEYVALFDHDDLLVDVALEVMVRAAVRTGAKVLYSDEDKVDPAGYFLEPHLKPDWNHRYLLGCNYVCHLLMVQASVLRAVGPLRSEYNGSQDHDLVLRLAEHVAPSEIHHVPEVLYHWRKTPGSTAVTLDNKGYAAAAGAAAVVHHLDRLGKKAAVRSHGGLPVYDVEWLVEDEPRVCVIIPYRDEIGMTRRCLDSLRRCTAWSRLEVVLVDNWSTSEEAARFAREASALPGVRVLGVLEEFNFSRLNNLAAAQTEAEFLVFLNNDVLITRDDWLRRLVGEVLADEDVAAVGGKLVYPDGRVQHAGVVVGPAEVGTHVHRGLPADDFGYAGRAVLAQEMTAVTAACMLVRAEAFRAVGCFDETALKVAYNDVDLCLKFRAIGRKVVLAGGVLGEHHESYSRGSDDHPDRAGRFAGERQVMLDRWRKSPLFARDPAYNPHLVPAGPGFSDLVPPGDRP
jgi:GT2 family glycosyltransferase